MLMIDVFKIPVLASLVGVVAILAATMWLSLKIPPREAVDPLARPEWATRRPDGTPRALGIGTVPAPLRSMDDMTRPCTATTLRPSPE
jgi:hypothetical protein